MRSITLLPVEVIELGVELTRNTDGSSAGVMVFVRTLFLYRSCPIKD